MITTLTTSNNEVIINIIFSSSSLSHLVLQDLTFLRCLHHAIVSSSSSGDDSHLRTFKQKLLELNNAQSSNHDSF